MHNDYKYLNIGSRSIYQSPGAQSRLAPAKIENGPGSDTDIHKNI